MGTDAAIGDQPDTGAPFAQHRRGACQTAAGFRRQILALDANRCPQQKQRIDAVQAPLPNCCTRKASV